MKHISTLTRCWSAYTHRNLLGIDLSPSEHAVIAYLAHQEKVNQDDISDHLALDKGTIARTLVKLEEKNLATRTVNESNRREKLVSLTPYGKSETALVMEISEHWKQSVMQGIAPNDQINFFSILEQIAQNAKTLCQTTEGMTRHEN